ncbi:MAG: hypothetical protein U5O39_12760 [Gammaproteobacteria bacterium]|nr:hypothetical protein [Gammaproteobacteria bacterium]
MLQCVVLLWLMSLCGAATAHGGVVLEDDMCVIKIGFLKAHFTLYQPAARGNEEFCGEVPVSGGTRYSRWIISTTTFDGCPSNSGSFAT